MNKRFSTLLAAALVAGSSFSAFAQLDDARKVEWGKQKTNRAYYLGETHKDASDASYFQALAWGDEPVDAGNISASNTCEKAQWLVSKNAQGFYSFKNVSDNRFIAFSKKEDGTYEIIEKADDANKEGTLRYFKLTEKGYLQLMTEGASIYLGRVFVTDKGWTLGLVSKNDANSVVAGNVTLYEIYNDQVTAKTLAEKFGENITLEFPEELDGTDVFENVTIKAVGTDGGFYLVDDKGTADTKDDEYVVLTSDRVSNSLSQKDVVGYYYKRMTSKVFDKAVSDKKIVAANRVFYAEESATNIGKDVYAIVQKGVKVSSDVTGANATFGKVTNDETVRQLASDEYTCHSTFFAITIGKGTRVDVKEVANAKRLIVNVTAKVKDKKNPSALGLSADLGDVNWYTKVSDAEFDQPQGQWLVAKGTEDNTIQLINVQKPLYTIDNIKLYEAEGENTYKAVVTGWDFETITLTPVEDYDYKGANGYYNKLSDKGQKFAFMTLADDDVDMYLTPKDDNSVELAHHSTAEWDLLRNEKADAVTVDYKYYNGTKWVEFKGAGKPSDGILPADTIRLAYSYEFKAGNKSLAGAWKMADAGYPFYLKEKGEGTYAIVWGGAAEVSDCGNVNDNNTLVSGYFSEATPFEIIDLSAVPSLNPNSCHMTFEATNGIGFIAANENNSAVLAKEAAALWVDSVNVEGFATPKFFISYAGKMMTTFAKLEEIAKAAFDRDEITKAELDALVKESEYKNAKRVKFVAAERLAGEDTLVIGGEKYTGAKIDAFKFTITENADGDYVMKNVATGEYVYSINGQLVYSDKNEEVEAFVIEATDAPTANEGVEVATVKVVAGEGNVTIAGAAGKKVVISNILGQVVANTVLASDNAVIAAPAGVVVVAVEGEAAVKAIVK